MTDLEICVDGLVSDRIRDMNAMVEATRQELEKRYHADTEDLTMRTPVSYTHLDVYKRQE